MKKSFSIWWDWPSYATQPSVKLIDANIDMAEVWPDHICAGVVEIELGEPPTQDDFTPAKIAAYRKEIGNHSAAITALEGKIQSLLCIEHKPEGDQNADAL